jgi:hypothetical protein
MESESELMAGIQELFRSFGGLSPEDPKPEGRAHGHNSEEGRARDDVYIAPSEDNTEKGKHTLTRKGGEV